MKRSSENIEAQKKALAEVTSLYPILQSPSQSIVVKSGYHWLET